MGAGRVVRITAGIAGAAFVSALLYICFLHPAHLKFSEGIPYTLQSTDKAPRMLVQGDHLQLKYHFDLAADMIAGKIPVFANLYEFNLGDDSERRIFDPYYIPFSLVYAAVRGFAGDAAAWNFTQYVSVFAGFIFLYLLARRYTGGSGYLAFLAALAAESVPYAWVNLAGGSPTGFGMGLIPGVVLGLDIAVRDRRERGGVLAGVMLFFCYCSDLHCFLFSALSVPFWCIVFWFSTGGDIIPGRKDALRLVRALWPVAAAGAAAIAAAAWLRASYSSTDVAGGRALSDMAAYSPRWRALFSWEYPCPAAAHFSLGQVLPVLLLAAAVTTAWVLAAKVVRERRGVLPLVGELAIFGGILAVIMLALGTSGPCDALPVRVMRKLFPPYAMIRQPVKIFCLMPTLTALAFAVFMRRIRDAAEGSAPWGVSLALMCLLILPTSMAGMRAGICLLPGANGAYEAVVEEGRERGVVPRALVLPIWPGDSSWSSIYEYYASVSGLRMLNGYSPVKSNHYVDEVFEAFETVTLGDLTPDQLEKMRRFGVTAVILHEDAFPDKVSPLPVGATLRRLLSCPNLKFLARDGAVWSFAVLDSPRTVPAEEERLRDGVRLYPTKFWTYVRDGDRDGMRVPEGIDRRFVLRVRKPAVWMNGDGPVWVMKASGETFWADAGGRPAESRRFDEGSVSLTVTDAVPVRGGDWAEAAVLSGGAGGRLKYAVYMPGPIEVIESDTELNPADFSHAGRIVWKDGEFCGVELDPAKDPSGEIVYGPNLPIAGGRWHLSVETEGVVPAAGGVRVLLNGLTVSSGLASSDGIVFDAADGDLFCLRYDYDRSAECVISRFVLRRVSGAGAMEGQE